MLNAVLCKSCENLIHGRCAKIKGLTNRLVIDLKYRKCKVHHKNVEFQKEKLHDDVETVTEFLYLGDRINSGGGCETAVTFRTGISIKSENAKNYLVERNVLRNSKELHIKAV